MYKRFDFLMTLLLGVFTGGIFNIYVWFTMSETNNAIARKHGIPEIQNYIIAFLLSLVTCGIYFWYWDYKFSEQQIRLAQIYGVEMTPTNEPILMFLLHYVPYYSYYVLCENYNRVVDVANKQ